MRSLTVDATAEEVPMTASSASSASSSSSMASGGDPGGGPRPASSGVRRAHAQILRQLALMADLARGPEAELAARAPAVSGWSVAEQLEHLVLVDRAVLKSLGRILDDPRRAPTGINLVGRVVLGTGFLPRGRARTTAPFYPGAEPAAVVRAALPEIERGLRELAPRLGEIEASAGRARHPRFGQLGGRQWLRFMAVHHHHHLKIVRDIRRARGLATAGLPSR
jgi:hypothetical protein